MPKKSEDLLCYGKKRFVFFIYTKSIQNLTFSFKDYSIIFPTFQKMNYNKLKQHYWFPTGFASIYGYWTDHVLNHKQLLQNGIERLT